MKARVVVFPIKGRNWCFSRSLDSAVASESNSSPPTLRDLWKKISSRSRTPQERAESVADYVADKMSRSWSNFEKAPPGTLKSRIHSLGLRLLSGVRPSEIFLKSVSKDITKVEITYPTRYYLYQIYPSFGFCFVHILIGELSREVRGFCYWFQTALAHRICFSAMRKKMDPQRTLLVLVKMHQYLDGFCSLQRTWRDSSMERTLTMTLIVEPYPVSATPTI
ncbi:uncharacterized protein [Typha angustifolia]|uniref:uncharacterized protein isoform X2 n=1 Tax=Typha angustifolia TaxID=59011 RepID=UPI003C2E81F9